MHPGPRLFILLPVLFALAGCSQQSPTYTEQTAAIDPALSTPPDNTAPDTTPPATDTMSKDNAPAIDPAADPSDKVVLTDDQWRAILSDGEFYILRRSGTEYAGTGRYLDNDKSEKGAYHCVGCGNKLYDAKHKFHSGCGWPSFNQEVEPGAITTIVDKSHGMIRTEMRCARCGGHLGHVFNDGYDQPTGLRHCVNGNILIFVPEGADVKDVIREHRKQYADQ